ncbi:MAG: class I SAM-dependent methyltransferase [Acidobacteria bacterium]|nr:class I SAM-dependent methyltransferase [Acidobacteriota bacterium]
MGRVGVQHLPIASFRDPAGRLFVVDGQLIRLVARSWLPDLEALLASSEAQRFVELGHLVSTRLLDSDEARAVLDDARGRDLLDELDGAVAVGHERIPFPSFPWEWPAEMLHAAGSLTLDLAEGLLDERIGLKDATPYNVVFRGPQPVFVDILSVERRAPGDPVWLPYAQFVRTFLLPLLVNRSFGISLEHIFTTRREGFEPEEVYRMCGPLRRLLPPFLTLASLPTWAGRQRIAASPSLYRPKELRNRHQARFALQFILRGLRRKLNRLAPGKARRSYWSEYLTASQHLSAEDFNAKRAFVENLVEEFQPRNVLDAGCNTGYFSAVAARHGARVVAIDSDPVVVGELWRTARAQALDILPLVVNLARPSPAVGWRNQECPAFLERAQGGFDAVFLFALMHHLLVTERVPLPEIIALAADLTTRFLAIEFISPEDAMFRRLARGRDALYQKLNRDVFETACRRHFDLVRCQPLSHPTRWLYLWEKKN